MTVYVDSLFSALDSLHDLRGVIVVDGAEAAEARVPGVHLGGGDLEPPGMKAGRVPAHRLIAAEVLELKQHVELGKPVLGHSFRISFPLPQALRGGLAVTQPRAKVRPSRRSPSGHRR